MGKRSDPHGLSSLGGYSHTRYILQYRRERPTLLELPAVWFRIDSFIITRVGYK